MSTMSLDRGSIQAVGLIVGLLAMTAAMLFGMMAFVLQGRFVVSDLVLTATGCAAVARHGGAVEVLPAPGLCLVVAEYDSVGWFGAHATLQLPVSNGTKSIELRSEDIVSRSTRKP